MAESTKNADADGTTAGGTGAYDNTTAYDMAAWQRCGRSGFGQSGFSLMEVLACIAVLAILCVPILHSFVNSADYNSRAFDMQNVTAYTQSVTELVKSASREEFETLIIGEGGGLDPEASGVDTVRQGKFPGVPAECFTVSSYVQENIELGGSLYDLRVTYDPLPYSEEKGISESSTQTAANDANVFSAASVGSVDGMRFAVISDEINRFEGTENKGGAILYNLLGQLTQTELVGLTSAEPAATLESRRLKEIYANTGKQVVVTVRDGGGDAVSVQCDVIYTLQHPALSESVELSYNVYHATFELEAERDGAGHLIQWVRGGKIYLFAKAWQDQNLLDMPRSNVITVKNEYSGSDPLEIYLVRGYYSDAGADGAEPTYRRGLQFDQVSVDGGVYSQIPSAADLTGEYSDAKTNFHTNVKGVISGRYLTEADMDQAVGQEKAAVKCYEVTVTLTEQESGREEAHIVTTKPVK